MSNPWALAAGLEDDSAIVDQVQVNISETHDEDGVPLEYNDIDTGEAIAEPIEAQAVEAELEVEDAEDVVEKLQDTAEDLENHLVGIESRIRSEQGLTANEVSTMLVGLHRTFPNIAAIHPGNESFNHSRLSASLEVKDRIVSGIQELWRKIKAMVERVLVKMTQWFAKLFSQAARTLSKVQAIKKKAQNTKGGAQDDTIEISGIADTLADSTGKIPTGATEIRAHFDRMLQITNWVFGPVNVSTKGITQELKDKFKTLISDVSAKAAKDTNHTDMKADVDFLKNLAITPNKLVGPTQPTKTGDSRFEGLAPVTVAELPGNKGIFYKTGIKPERLADDALISTHYQEMGPVILDFNANTARKIENKQDFATLSSGNVVSLCDTAITILKKIVEFKSGYRDVTNYNKDLQKEIDKAVAAAGRDSNLKKNSAALAATSQMIRGSGSMMQKATKFYPKISALLIKIINAVMLWCTRSLSNHKLD